MDSKHHVHELKAADRPMRRGHIGLIVAGSLMTGFVVSIVLVIGPFGGGQEHVIMGTALVGWALVWGLLAVLSRLWTDHPQQWAVVPAALMALTGASLLIFRPDANAFNLLGWIWPPALIALAVWMTVQARGHLRSFTRPFVLYPLFVALVIAGVAGSYETIQDQVARMVMLDSQPNEAFTGLPDFPSFYNIIRPTSALFPSLARLGVFRLINQFSPDILPAQTRDEERAVTSTASLNRIQRDEFAELPTTLKGAAALTTIGDRPLIVVTAAKGASAGWLPLQDKMAGLSTNSVHRVLPDTDHPGVIDDRIGAAQASQ